jgi:hypothetical protein
MVKRQSVHGIPSLREAGHRFRNSVGFDSLSTFLSGTCHGLRARVPPRMVRRMIRDLHADREAAPWLDFVATGGQGTVFGTPTWVVKIPRASWQTALGRVLVHPATPVRAMEVLGGLVEPCVLLERIVFRAPCVVDGRVVSGNDRVWRARWAVAGARLASGDFLDRRIAAATPGEAADLIGALLDTLDAIRARGWHVLDFIMSNFVVGPDRRVRLVDTGLLIPVSHLRGPSQQICSRLFVRRLAPDYAEVLAGVAARQPEEVVGRARLAAVIDVLRPRLGAWRAGRVRVPAAVAQPADAAMDPALRAEVLEALAPARHKLPLTRRRLPGYTPRHHAITSEN